MDVDVAAVVLPVVRFPHGETVTVLREQRDPATGVTTLVDDRDIEGCGWSPSAQWQANAFARDDSYAEVGTGRALYTPPGSGLVTGRRVRFPDGTVWEVNSDAGQWRSPLTGWVPGDHVNLKRVTPPP